MARIRNIKPAFFKDSELYDAEKATGLPLRVAYAGLWTVADRAGRFKWKPREIKTDVLPYDDVDMEAVLVGLVNAKKIFRYKSGGFEYGFVLNFEKHQFINRNEVASQLPEPPTNIPEYSEIVSNCELLVVLDTDTDGLTQVVAAPPPTKPPRKVTSTLPSQFPDRAAKDAALGYWADRDRMDLVVDDEAAAFRAHHLQHGNRMADWGQAWVTWYSKAIKFNRKPSNGRAKATAHDTFIAAGLSIIDGGKPHEQGPMEGAGDNGADGPVRALLPP
ncbi:MAG TPA: hypothetical protein VHN11_12700 [Xanthobacteraceae bacterium]|jgi:hypothetical protein|nr:hypothetical protein [Xanthobacteraceae bacterium]